MFCPVFSGSVTGFVREAEAAGFGVLLATSDYDAKREAAAVELFLSQRVAGVALTLTAPSRAALDVVRQARVPLVLLDEPWVDGGNIIVLEPRRLAARAARTSIRAGRGR